MNTIFGIGVLVIGVVAVGATGALFTKAWRDRVTLARLTTVVAVLTLAVIAIVTIVIGYTLLFAKQVGITVPIEVTEVKIPEGIVFHDTVATIVSGGADQATLVVEGLSWPTRLLLLTGELAGTLTIGAVALIALKAARALRGGDIFSFAPRAIMTAAIVVAVGGVLWTLMNDIGTWRAGIEALHISGFVLDGPLSERFDGDSDLFLAEHGWPTPASLTLTFPFWPLGVSLGLALVAAAFQAGQRLRDDVEHLQDDVRGLV